jgi:hypothetical protein
MRTAKKAIITLAAVLLTASFSTSSFAITAVLIGLLVPAQPAAVCFYVFGGQICIPR